VRRTVRVGNRLATLAIALLRVVDVSKAALRGQRRSVRDLRRGVGLRVGRAGGRLLAAILELALPDRRDEPLWALEGVKRILVVRPNFRLGNALISAPRVLALRKRFPCAQVDYLTGDRTVDALANLPIDRVYGVSRGDLLRPWRAIALFRRLRVNRYDLAVVGTAGSLSGCLYAYLTGARHRLGHRGKGDRLLTVRIPSLGSSHAYDGAVAFARELGVSCPDRPVYSVGKSERETALALLARLRLVGDDGVAPFVSLLIGGHAEKRWDVASWVSLARGLCAAGVPAVVLLGPEERHLTALLMGALPASARIVSPQRLPVFAALLGLSSVAVTTDSGPMHLAAALGTPTIAILRWDLSLRYAPRGASDRSFMRPHVQQVIASVLEHTALARGGVKPAPSAELDRGAAPAAASA